MSVNFMSGIFGQPPQTKNNSIETEFFARLEAKVSGPNDIGACVHAWARAREISQARAGTGVNDRNGH